MKQTAVEWLQSEIDNKDMGEIPMWIYEFIEQAKEMEKEQITYCYDFVSSKICTQCDDFKTGEQYYNETFKSE
jgi:hypothetical protein